MKSTDWAPITSSRTMSAMLPGLSFQSILIATKSLRSSTISGCLSMASRATSAVVLLAMASMIPALSAL